MVIFWAAPVAVAVAAVRPFCVTVIVEPASAVTDMTTSAAFVGVVGCGNVGAAGAVVSCTTVITVAPETLPARSVAVMERLFVALAVSVIVKDRPPSAASPEAAAAPPVMLMVEPASAMTVKVTVAAVVGVVGAVGTLGAAGATES